MSQEHTPDKNTHWWRWQCPLAEYFSPHICSIIILVWFFVFVRHTHVTCADIACERVCVCVLPCRSQCSPLVSPGVQLIPVSYWQLRSGTPGDDTNTSRHACVTVGWVFSDTSHDLISTDMRLKLLIDWKCPAAQWHSRADESVSPSLDCPTETFLLLRVIKKNDQHMTGAPVYYLCVRLWGLAIIKGPCAAISGVLSEPKRTNGQRSD